MNRPLLLVRNSDFFHLDGGWGWQYKNIRSCYNGVLIFMHVFRIRTQPAV